MKLIRLPDVEARVGLKRTTIYRLIKDGKFPAPMKQGTGSFWMDTEIATYLEEVAAARPAASWHAGTGSPLPQ